jgi:hypothetical protein
MKVLNSYFVSHDVKRMLRRSAVPQLHVALIFVLICVGIATGYGLEVVQSELEPS